MLVSEGIVQRCDKVTNRFIENLLLKTYTGRYLFLFYFELWNSFDGILLCSFFKWWIFDIAEEYFSKTSFSYYMCDIKVLPINNLLIFGSGKILFDLLDYLIVLWFLPQVRSLLCKWLFWCHCRLKSFLLRLILTANWTNYPHQCLELLFEFGKDIWRTLDSKFNKIKDNARWLYAIKQP